MSATDIKHSHPLSVYNTLGGVKQRFVPIDRQRVTMYVCGPTVYNLAHIGNARPVVVFDVLFRLLRHLYPQVVYARNITDVDDKIIAAAREGQRSIEAVTEEFTTKYREDMAALNTLRPSLEPHATHNIAAMIELTARLIETGHAYESAGHVLFAVQSMPDYGKLSGRSLEDMLAGARVEVADYKRYPGDFVLWKPAADDEPGWESPWGWGRPGWHLECSAMIRAHLGDSIDIHGGGRDLIFPHHENEIAQSRCSHDGDFVRYWMHNAYLDMDGEKMSKSLGNVKTVRELLQYYRGEVLRFALLSAHYRSPLNFSGELLSQAESALGSLYNTLRDVREIEVDPDAVDLSVEAGFHALCDDLNTPGAISELHALAHQLHKSQTSMEQTWLKARLLALGNLLGLLQQDPVAWMQGGVEDGGLDAAAIEEKIADRAQAKKDKNFARADAIRAELLEQGVVLEDSREGTQWRRA